MKNNKIMVSLFDYSTVMALPWAEAGYDCYCMDIKHNIYNNDYNFGTGIFKIYDDMLMPCNNRRYSLIRNASFIAAFPPCTDLAVSGARWFKSKGMKKLIQALSLVEETRRLCEDISTAPFMIENPVSTLSTYWRKPDYKFNPCDYAGYLDDPSSDAYTKKTCLWTGNGFVMPEPKPVDPTQGSKMHVLPPSKDRASLRSVTLAGFAQAIFEVNNI